MTSQSADQLVAHRCVSCEGGIEKYSPAEVQEQLKQLPGWRLTHDGLRIRKDWRLKDFAAGLDLFRRVGELAESEGHHPDLHLEEYRYVWIEIWTHAIGGLSENDFILAAKIDRLPVALSRSANANRDGAI